MCKFVLIVTYERTYLSSIFLVYAGYIHMTSKIYSKETTSGGVTSTDEDIVQDVAKKSDNRFYTDPWFQIVLISFISFCNPGMYNALTGMGGSGQVDSTVAANSNVATHAATAVAALFLVAFFYKYLGPRLSLVLGGWTYALYSGSLLNYNRTGNGAFVVAAGALLGIGAAFFWVAQGTIMVTYTNEATHGRAIGLFWIIFNFGATLGSFISFGINYGSTAGTVTDSTYVAYIVVMLFGWVLSLLVVSPDKLNSKYDGAREREHAKLTWSSLKSVTIHAIKILADWRLFCLYPMFYNANVFYSYQQNNVNGETFDLRSRALNGALYWLAQMFGGFLIGYILDSKLIGNRRSRALVGWGLLFVTGMVIWGGGYKFQVWQNARLAQGLKQDIDFKQKSLYIGPMFLYFFYGMYDSFWQSFCYWMIGTRSKSPAANAIAVGAYSALKPAGGAMAWRINAEAVSPMKQFAMNWGLTIGSLVVAIPSVYSLPKVFIDEETLDNKDEVANDIATGDLTTDNETEKKDSVEVIE